MEGSREEGAHFPDAAPEYVAHISEDGERVESVETHLRQVAQLASTFADDFGAASWAYAAGIAHDIGKFPLLSSGESCTMVPKSIIRRRVLRSLANMPQECSRIALPAIMAVCRMEGRSSMMAERFLVVLTLPSATQFPITQAIAMKSRYLAPMLRDSASFHRTTKAGRSARRS